MFVLAETSKPPFDTACNTARGPKKQRMTGAKVYSNPISDILVSTYIRLFHNQAVWITLCSPTPPNAIAC